MAPHIVYSDAGCPHDGCGQPMQAIDFRLEDHGRAIHDPLVRSWWNDTGFAGRCPHCGGWVHFTLRAKRAITPDTALRLAQYFKTSAEFWMSMQTTYDLETARVADSRRLGHDDEIGLLIDYDAQAFAHDGTTVHEQHVDGSRRSRRSFRFTDQGHLP